MSFAQNWLGGLAQGRQRRLEDEALGKQNRLAELAGDAFSAPLEQRGDYIAQMARYDPETAVRFQNLSDGQADRQRTQIGNMAKMLAVAPEQYRGSMYAKVAPALRNMGIEAPEQWDDSMLPVIQSLGGDDAQGAQSAQRAYVEWMAQQVPEDERGEFFRVQAGLAPRAQNQQFSIKEVENADGTVSFVPVATRGGNVAGPVPSRPAPTGNTGAPNMDSIIAQANEMARRGVPDAQIEQYIASAARQGGVSVTPASNAMAAPSVTAAGGQATNETRSAAEANAAAARIRAETLAKAEAEYEASAPRRESSAAALTDTINAVEPVLEKAIGQISGWTSGVGSWLSILPGTEANDLKRNLETLQARLSFDELARMRAASPTGGALGAVSERELTLLGATVRSLEQDQSPAQLMQNMQAIKYHYDRWKMTVNGIDPDNPMEGADAGGPSVVRTGRLSDGRRVMLMSDGRTVDESGQEIR